MKIKMGKRYQGGLFAPRNAFLVEVGHDGEDFGGVVVVARRRSVHNVQ